MKDDEEPQVQQHEIDVSVSNENRLRKKCKKKRKPKPKVFSINGTCLKILWPSTLPITKRSKSFLRL